MTITTTVRYENTVHAHVTATCNGATRVYIIRIKDAIDKYTSMSTDDAVSRVARRLFKDDCDASWVTTYQ